MTLPGYAAGRFGTHYTAPPACAQEILGFFRTEEGSAGSRRAIRMQFRPSGGQFAGTEARSAQTAPGGIQHGERGMERRSS